MYKFDRHALEELYKSYIQPSMEYGEMWDNVTQDESDRLKGVQLKAARTVLGTLTTKEGQTDITNDV